MGEEEKKNICTHNLECISSIGVFVPELNLLGMQRLGTEDSPVSYFSEFNNGNEFLIKLYLEVNTGSETRECTPEKSVTEVPDMRI